MRTNYQNIKFFNKEGYEIPLAKASNIVVKIYSNEINSERYATIMNGVYMEEVDEEGNYILNNFKILDVGSSFDSENISIDNTIIDLYIDGVLVDSSLYSVKDNLLDFEIESFMTIKTTTMGNNDEEYKKYGISGVNNFSLIIKKDDNIDLIFPSYVFTGNIEMETVSTGLHSTESIYFGIVGDEGKLLSVEEDNYDILFLTDVKDDDIQFFTFDDVTEEIYKSHSAYVNLSSTNSIDIEDIEGFNNAINIQKYIHTPQCVNFCCMSEKEGVHQQTIYVMLVDRQDRNKQYKIGEFEVSINIEGEDERFRALFANFGIPDPITYPNLFKSVDVKEDKVDWEIVNRKSKELFLSYDEIFPYVGTYKALINAIKFLGYDDVYFREWYKDIKDNTLISKRININDNFNDYKLDLSFEDILEDRLTRKKLNKLSLIYQLNKESGKYDKDNTPIIVNSYDYNVDEIVLKLNSLKEWLEKHILSLNCRIVDITGEGIVYEKVPFKIYGTNMQNFEYEECIDFTPLVKDKIVELDSNSNAKIDVIFKNNSKNSYLQVEDMDGRIGDYDNNSTISYPHINDMVVKAFVECENAKIHSQNSYLFINEGEIFLEKGKDTFIFDKAPIIYIEKGYIKNIVCNNSEDFTLYEWWDKKDYIIDELIDDAYGFSHYIKEVDRDVIYKSNDYICLLPNENSSLRYSVESLKKNNSYYNALEAPVFILNNYSIVRYGIENNALKMDLNGEYIVDIIDGKIVLNENNDKTTYININYDEDSKEQSVKVNYQYEGHRDEENTNEDAFYINVNNAGHYDIVAYAINDSGNFFGKKIEGGCDVLTSKKDLKIITRGEVIENDKDFYIEKSKGEKAYNIPRINYLPTFKPNYIIHSVTKDSSGNYIYPNISYAYDTPKQGDYLQFMNICDKVYCDGTNLIKLFKETNNNLKSGNLHIVEYDESILNGKYEYEDSTSIRKGLKNKYLYVFPVDSVKIDNIVINEELNETVITISNKSSKSRTKSNNTNAIYKENDIIRMNYYVTHSIVILNNVIYYMDENDGQLYPVLDLNGNYINYNSTMLLSDVVSDGEILQETFGGSSSFRIKSIEDNVITLYGIFNYRELLEDNLLSSLNISRSNQAYVNYILKCVDCNEYVSEDGKNMSRLSVEENIFDYFIDDTYTFIPLSFDKNNAFNYWDSTGRYTYVHKNTPLTLSKEDRIIVYHEEDVKNTIYWRLYRRSIDTETRELLFEVVNDNLPLNISDEGIYDIEMDVFDIYGNKSHNCYNAILKVK